MTGRGVGGQDRPGGLGSRALGLPRARSQGAGRLPGRLGSDCVGNPCRERRVGARAHCAGESVWNPCWRLGAGRVGGVYQPGGGVCGRVGLFTVWETSFGSSVHLL